MGKVYKVAPRVSLTSKGGIIDDGTEVTAANFASEDVFNSLISAKKIMTAEEYNARWEELNKPQEDEAALAKKAHDAEMKKAIEAAVEKATEEARKKFEAEYAKKEKEASKAEDGKESEDSEKPKDGEKPKDKK